jgi:hypothetical protein
MKWPPKREGALLHAPIATLGLWTAYLIAKLLANTLDWPFWLAEQWRGRLADELESEGLRQ